MNQFHKLIYLGLLISLSLLAFLSAAAYAKVRVAVCQILVIDGDRDGNFRRIEYALQTAREQHANIATFPESSILGWENPYAHKFANATGRRGNELVFRGAQLGASLIRRLGNTVWSVAGQVFFKSVAKKATAGSFGFTSQVLGPFEDVFRNRDSSFHTGSITALLTQRQESRLGSDFSQSVANWPAIGERGPTSDVGKLS
jgi:carbon-nitrogen hydrolase